MRDVSAYECACSHATDGANLVLLHGEFERPRELPGPRMPLKLTLLED